MFPAALQSKFLFLHPTKLLLMNHVGRNTTSHKPCVNIILIPCCFPVSWVSPDSHCLLLSFKDRKIAVWTSNDQYTVKCCLTLDETGKMYATGRMAEVSFHQCPHHCGWSGNHYTVAAQTMLRDEMCYIGSAGPFPVCLCRKSIFNTTYSSGESSQCGNKPF